jgi:hypothetical protein
MKNANKSKRFATQSSNPEWIIKEEMLRRRKNSVTMDFDFV